MDADRWTRLNDLVADALEAPAGRRDAVLGAEPDADLRAEARALVQASDDAQASHALDSPFQAPSLPGPVGPWTPTARLGAGGMGVVYAAERAGEGFRQRAALKLIRPGHGPDFRDRFVRERALLAGLDHPGVARLLDGGVTADGLPYLAMELVDGEPVTAYAEARDLGLRARLGLFLQASQAVAHAHRRLVVHRDLKPAHIVVAEAEGGPHVKLLDFGIAKLLDDGGADALTQTGGGPLTPQYASPEQLDGTEVTTATDVYSLGVVLYELLTGRRPYDLKGLAPSQAQRVVAETVPLRPSANADGSTATRRLRGDLDTVVLKALAKEPERRYPSVEALADDVQRFLDELPVKARPDTWGYRAGKFVGRHRAAVAAASVALAALLGGAGLALWQARVAEGERDRAETEAAKAEAVTDFLTAMLGASDPTEDGQGVRVADLIERASADADSVLADQPEVEAAVRVALGKTFMELSRHADAERELRRAVALYDRTAGPVSAGAVDARGALGEAYLAAARYPRADSVLSAALRAERALGRGDTQTLATLLANLGVVRYYEGDLDGLIVAQKEAIGILERLPDADPLEIAAAQGNVATALSDLDRFDEAIPMLERRVALYRRALPPGNLSTARALNGLASGLFRAGRTDDALPVQREAIQTMRAALAGSTDRLPRPGGEPIELVRVLTNHVAMLLDAGRLAEAERTQADAEALVGAFRTPNAASAHVLYTRAALLDRTGEPDEAARVAARSASVAAEAVGPRTREAADGWALRGQALLHAGRPGEAAAPLRRARSIFAEIYGETHAETAAADSLLRLSRRR